MQQLEMLETTDKRRCIACKEVKHKDFFAKQADRASGVHSKCKNCSRAYSREHYRRNKESYLKRGETYAKNSVKTKAKKAVHYALKIGKLIKQPCEKCGAEKADAHHDDYAKPLEVRWLCRSHHIAWHAEFGEAPHACTVRHWTPPKEAQK